MQQLDNVKELTMKQLSFLEKELSLDEETAITSLLDCISLSYLKNEDEVDAFDLIVAYTLFDRKWQDILNVKLFHDIYYSKYFEETSEDVMGFSDGPCPQLLLPVGLAKKYVDYLYKKGNEDIDALIWRCLCIGCIPNSEFLKLSEEKRKDTFTDDIKWVVLDDLLNLSEDEIDMAVNLTSVVINDDECLLEKKEGTNQWQN